MSGRGSARRAAQLQCAAALSVLCASPALAQQAQPQPPPADPAELDPSAPLDPLPGLGVDWPTLSTDESAVPQAAQQAPAENAAGDRKYVLEITGLGSVG